MNEYVKSRLKDNEKLRMYLRDNSYWYKILSRDPNKIIDMENEMKDKYGLRFKDKIEKVNNIIEIINMLK